VESPEISTKSWEHCFEICLCRLPSLQETAMQTKQLSISPLIVYCFPFGRVLIVVSDKTLLSLSFVYLQYILASPSCKPLHHKPDYLLDYFRRLIDVGLHLCPELPPYWLVIFFPNGRIVTGPKHQSIHHRSEERSAWNTCSRNYCQSSNFEIGHHAEELRLHSLWS
jgi:hypothetical protein